MTDLQELYQAVILDHNRSPRNFGPLETADGRADGRNPLCGDECRVEVRLDGDRIHAVGFTGHGCAISKASASLMTAAVKGRSREEAEALFERFHAIVTGREAPPPTGRDPQLGQLVALAGVSRFPIRVKCASLAWHTLRAALANAGDGVPADAPAVSTE
jgi:nitrogen fixation NifU-like protein